MTFSLNLNLFDNFSIVKTNNDNLLILNKNKKEFFIKLPKNVSYKVHQDNLELYTDTIFEETLLTIHKNISFFLNSNSSFKKKLVLNGLGFKVTNENKKIDFKLGYSHLKSLAFPNFLDKLSIKKKKITFESADKIKLGNFAQKVYHLRKYDTYKAKGFSFLGVKKNLKEIKKK
jgi:ribosomal protein L6P/L9E